jgi:predicted RNase H-like nuclease (RuvC/YqgF family)
MEEMTEEQRAAMNSVFKRVQELDHENKQLILERAKLNQKVGELETKLRRAQEKIDQQGTLDTQYLDNFRHMLRGELEFYLRPASEPARKAPAKKRQAKK